MVGFVGLHSNLCLAWALDQFFHIHAGHTGMGVHTVISFYVRRDTNDGSKNHSRNAIIAAIAACGLGLGLGGYHYLTNGGPVALPIMFMIDIAIIAAGAWWLTKARAKA